MPKFRNFTITGLSYFPFARFLLKALYINSLNQFRELTHEFEDIEDIYLISKLEDKNFVFGLSDMNFVIIVKDEARPKKILQELRKILRGKWPLNILIDRERLPVLKLKEFNTPLIQSFLVSDIENSEFSWLSVYQNKVIKFKCTKQGRYASKFFLFRKFEKFLQGLVSYPLNKNWLRSYGKFITMGVKRLHNEGLIKNQNLAEWQKVGSKISFLTPLSFTLYKRHNELTWKALANDSIPYNRSIGDSSQYPKSLLYFCERLMVQDCIEDILLTPALLQIHDKKVRGKVFIDVVLSERKETITYKRIKHIKKMIRSFDEDIELQEEIKVKTDFNLTTLSLLSIQSQKSLFPYPLEVYYRQRRTFSVRGRRYQIKVSKPVIEKSIIHFILLQFMRFRSNNLKSSLIGSKFIKSLNLMNRYALLLEFLEKKDFEVPKNYAEMLEKVTPQLSEMRSFDIVTKEDWALIQPQLLYTLKKIRDLLADYHPSIKNLNF